MLTAFQRDGSIDWKGIDALVEWYLASGVSGLFAVCLSSEMYQLTDEERLALARHVVGRCRGRVPVVASGTMGGELARQVAFAKRMAGTGVSAVVVITSALASAAESDQVWQGRMEQFLEQTGDLALGLYECPIPYKRLLSPGLLRWLASTGRFGILKDTSCELSLLRDKAAAISGTRLRLLNANTPTLLDSLHVGSHGFSGIGANFYPHLYVWLCTHAHDRRDQARALQRYLSIGDMMVRCKYPLSAKLFLAHQGLPIRPVCRIECPCLCEEERHVLRDLATIARSLSDAICT